MPLLAIVQFTALPFNKIFRFRLQMECKDPQLHQGSFVSNGSAELGNQAMVNPLARGKVAVEKKLRQAV